MTTRAPSVQEIVELLKKSGLSLYEEGKAGIKIVSAGNSVLLGEFDERGIQQRPGEKLARFLKNLPAKYFSPNQAIQVVKRGGGSAGESQRKYTSVRARLQARENEKEILKDVNKNKPVEDHKKSAYLGYESLDKKNKDIPGDLMNQSPSASHADAPRVMTYVKRHERPNGLVEFVRHIVMSEAYIDGRIDKETKNSTKRIDEVHISYTLTGDEEAIFKDPHFNEAEYLRKGGYASLDNPDGLAVRGLHIAAHDPNLEFKGPTEAANHFKKTSEYLERIAKFLFDAGSPSFLRAKYAIPFLRPLDWVWVVAHDQVRTREWVKLGEKGVSTATLGRAVDKTPVPDEAKARETADEIKKLLPASLDEELGKYQEAIIGKKAYREYDELSRTLVSMGIYLDPDKGWEVLSPEVVLGGKYKETDEIAQAVARLVDKVGPEFMEFIKHIGPKIP